jgi:hypothetical protein
MSYRMRRNLGMALVAVVVVAGAFLFVSRRSTTTTVTGLAPAGGDPFGEGDTVEGALRGILSPNGSGLAVITADGLGIVERNEVRPLTRSGANVVDVAWFGNGATLLVAEGPVPTGGLVVMDIDGHVRGTVRLEPSVGLGGGYGMDVAAGGKQAVVTAVDRPALGREERHVVVVDLETGATHDLTPPAGPDEQRPLYLGDGRVAYVESDPGQPASRRTMVVDLASGIAEELAPGEALVGVTDDGGAVTVDGTGQVRAGAVALGRVPSGVAVSSIDAASRVAVVAETVTAADGSRSTRLRRLTLSPDG